MSSAELPLEVAVERAVRAVRSKWQQTLPTVVDSTKWIVREGRILVKGGVLTTRQAEDYVAAVQPLVEDGNVPRPCLLSDPQSPWTHHRWVLLDGESPIDLVQAPGGELQNQWCPPAWLRLFAKSGDHSLIQLPDGSLGWVTTERLELEPTPPTNDPWHSIRRSQPDVALPAEPTIAAAAAADSPLGYAAGLARSRLGCPYRWGGNLPQAADCSGYIQSIVWQAANVLLPKHTGDQRQQGHAVDRTSIAAGDLVFVRGRRLGLQHVGLVLSANGTRPDLNVVHASMSHNSVLEDALPAFLDGHDYVETRRVVDWQLSPVAKHPSSSRES